MLTSKTFWTGIGMLAYAAGGYFTGALDVPTAVQIAANGLGLIFLRHAVAKL